MSCIEEPSGLRQRQEREARRLRCEWGKQSLVSHKPHTGGKMAEEKPRWESSGGGIRAGLFGQVPESTTNNLSHSSWRNPWEKTEDGDGRPMEKTRSNS